MYDYGNQPEDHFEIDRTWETKRYFALFFAFSRKFSKTFRNKGYCLSPPSQKEISKEKAEAKV